MKRLIPILSLILAACSPITAPPQTAAVSHLNRTTKTYAEKNWTITVPKTMVRQDPEPGQTMTFDALDQAHQMTMFLQAQETPVGLDQAASIFAMNLASKNIDVQSIKPATLSGREAVAIVSTKETNAGLMHFYSWATISQGVLYNFGCIAMPKATAEYAEKVCTETANTVKLNLLDTTAKPLTDDGN
jgi:hypothetical protein